MGVSTQSKTSLPGGGRLPAIPKKISEAVQIESDATARLKADLKMDRFSGRIQSVATTESTATITVATEPPKSRTDAKTKASETEIRIDSRGILMVNEPVRSVSAPRTNHSEGSCARKISAADLAAIAQPVAITTAKYRRCRSEYGVVCGIAWTDFSDLHIGSVTPDD